MNARGYVLPIPRPDNSDTSSRNILEPDVESTEVVADDDEDSIWFLGVLDFGQEFRGEAERERNLGGLVEVGLQDAPTLNGQKGLRRAEEHLILLVKDEESFQDLQIVLVGDSSAELVVQLGVRKRLHGLQALVRERGSDERKLRHSTLQGWRNHAYPCCLTSAGG